MLLVRLALLVSLYVAVDVANPMMPGALVFAVDDSVDARQWSRVRIHDETPAVAVAPARAGRIAPARSAMASNPARRRVSPAPVCRAHLPSPADCPSEDH
jgi:hypothetical protein